MKDLETPTTKTKLLATTDDSRQPTTTNRRLVTRQSTLITSMQPLCALPRGVGPGHSFVCCLKVSRSVRASARSASRSRARRKFNGSSLESSYLLTTFVYDVPVLTVLFRTLSTSKTAASRLAVRTASALLLLLMMMIQGSASGSAA